MNHFDSVIIGGSIHNGTIQGSVRNFIEQNREILMTKKLGLYLCCWHGGVSGVLQFNNAFTLALREKSIASGNFGGEMLISKMGFIEKQIAGYIAGITTDTSNMDLTEIIILQVK
ncbi:flavodoxin domain-containing protein [Bacillus sp. AFS076308]|uniref:flavodoxin domain-containing protein n=1 Tax=unclassified Bacillus (in: firmicutes) TaxID=185979 RepID=UPI002795E770|nr:flavodoxin domain-containing protein [Bacillus sp. AFS076308]